MTAYYNEFDPKAAAWLRELIKRGLIADGVVDERSILDVVADDLVGFTQCHFFAGIGGWSYALRLAGWQDDWQVWTGSPPCQPFSAAGQQKGQADDRHLAPHFAALVAAGRPPILFGEQVASSAVLGKAAKRAGGGAGEPPEWAWIDDLSDRLEAAHYAVGAADIPAAGVGAPHIRQRTFFGAIRLADTESGWQRVRQREQDGDAGQHRAGGGAGRLADTGGEGSQGRGGTDRSELGQDRHPAARSAASGVADTDEGERGRVADGEGRQHDGEAGGRQQGNREPERGGSGVGMADSGRPGADHGGWTDADWLFCRDGKWRPVEPGTFPLAHGIPARVVRLRGYGNAIVPQAAAQFVKAFVAAANY
jgi:DNA (cytosine-5)-methyltransferase 1